MIGAHVISFFQQLAAGESEGGSNTIGDRAVLGAHRCNWLCMERMFQRTGIKISRLRCTLFRHTYAFTSQIEILPFEFRKDREELLEKTN